MVDAVSTALEGHGALLLEVDVVMFAVVFHN